MAYWTQAEMDEILAAVQAKAPRVGACAFCQTLAGFSLSGDLVVGPLVTVRGGSIIGSPYLPMAAFLCNNCGNTQMLNLNILGLGHLLETKPRPSDYTAPGSPPGE